MSERLPILKTYKLVINGQFPRTESGRYFPVYRGKEHKEREKQLIANACQASRKDTRNAVQAARSAFAGWSQRTGYNRGQILYRMAEVLEQRQGEFLHEMTALGTSKRAAEKEIQAAIDRLVWYAGWADKYQALLGTVNPVAASYFNFTVPEPTGVVAIIAPDSPNLLGLIALMAPVIVSGNTCVVLASETNPLSPITFGEVLATSDVPGGVVNILTGFREELLKHLAAHMDVNALIYAAGDAAQATLAQREGVANVKRVVVRNNLTENDWYGRAAEDPGWIEATLEMKTVWHPIGV